jgi:hypothetical protein
LVLWGFGEIALPSGSGAGTTGPVTALKPAKIEGLKMGVKGLIGWAKLLF